MLFRSWWEVRGCATSRSRARAIHVFTDMPSAAAASVMRSLRASLMRREIRASASAGSMAESGAAGACVAYASGAASVKEMLSPVTRSSTWLGMPAASESSAPTTVMNCISRLRSIGCQTREMRSMDSRTAGSASDATDARSSAKPASQSDIFMASV